MTSDEIEKRAREACGCVGVCDADYAGCARANRFAAEITKAWNEAIEAATTEAFDGEDQIAIAALRITVGKP